MWKIFIVVRVKRKCSLYGKRAIGASIPTIIFFLQIDTQSRTLSWTKSIYRLRWHTYFVNSNTLLKTNCLAYTHMPEGGSLYRLPPPGSYPSKQVCMYPHLSVPNSIAKIFHMSSFLWRILFQLAHQTSWIIEDEILLNITSVHVLVISMRVVIHWIGHIFQLPVMQRYVCHISKQHDGCIRFQHFSPIFLELRRGLNQNPLLSK